MCLPLLLFISNESLKQVSLQKSIPLVDSMASTDLISLHYCLSVGFLVYAKEGTESKKVFYLRYHVYSQELREKVSKRIH